MPVSSRRFRYGIEHESALLRPDGSFADFTNTHLRRAAGHRRRAARGPGRPGGPARRRRRHQAQAVVRRGLRALRRARHAAALRPEGAGDPHADPPVGRGGRGRPVRRPAAPRRRPRPRGASASPRSGSTRCTRSTSSSPRSTRGSGVHRRAHARGADGAPAHGHLRARPQPVVGGVPGDRPGDELVDAARKLTALSPYLVPLSFSSPFRDGGPWGGLSARTALRTGARPAALAFLADGRAAGARRPVADPAARGCRPRWGAWSSRRSTPARIPCSTASCSAC